MFPLSAFELPVTLSLIRCRVAVECTLRRQSASVNPPFWEKYSKNLERRRLATDSTSKLSDSVCILVCIWKESLFLMEVIIQNVKVYGSKGKFSNCWNEVLQVKMSFNLATFKISRFLYSFPLTQDGRKKIKNFKSHKDYRTGFFSFLWHLLFISVRVVPSVVWVLRQQQDVLLSVLQGRGVLWRVNQTSLSWY